MKKTLIYSLLAVSLACSKNQQKDAANPAMHFQGKVLDTLQQTPIANCRIFRVAMQNQRWEIVDETYSDLQGNFYFDAKNEGSLFVFSHNDYAWKNEAIVAQNSYYLKPYVPSTLVFPSGSPLLPCTLRGGFNEDPINLEVGTNQVTVHSAAFDSLQLRFVQMSNDTIRISQWIRQSGESFQMP